MTIFYVTRGIYPYQQGGGNLSRRNTVELLRKRYGCVVVVAPNFFTGKIIEDSDEILIPPPKWYLPKVWSLLQRIGICEDYLDPWISAAFPVLSSLVKRDDLIYATSGGELGPLKLGKLLKEATGCRLLINFRDPLNYGYMNGLRRDLKPHVSRIKSQKCILNKADRIQVSSKVYKDALTARFDGVDKKIFCNYFGHMQTELEYSYRSLDESRPIRIAYFGAFSITQSPESLFHLFKYLIILGKRVEIFFIGDFETYAPVSTIKTDGVFKFTQMSRRDLHVFLRDVDIGYVCLRGDYYSACVPSKIYECINLGLPILASLPKGDGFDIINDNGFGCVAPFDDFDAMKLAFEDLTSRNVYFRIIDNLRRNRNNWAMSKNISEVFAHIDSLYLNS